MSHSSAGSGSVLAGSTLIKNSFLALQYNALTVQTPCEQDRDVRDVIFIDVTVVLSTHANARNLKMCLYYCTCSQGRGVVSRWLLWRYLVRYWGGGCSTHHHNAKTMETPGNRGRRFVQENLAVLFESMYCTAAVL